MENYLTKDEQELFDLINYHLQRFADTKIRQGGLHPDDIQKTKLLINGGEMIQSIVQARKKREEEKLTPSLTKCPGCNIEKERKPTGEEKSEHGYMCNNYHCHECNIVYLDYNPNNAKDQLKSLEERIAVIEKNISEMANPPDEIKTMVAELKEQHKIFIKACDEEEETHKNFQQALHQQTKVIAQWRDYLLIAKIKNQWLNPPTGLS